MLALEWTILLLLFTIAASSEVSPLVVVEHRGNSSLECISSGRCEACSFSEKQNEEVYHCSVTGYYMPYNCVEVTPDEEKKVGEESSSSNSVKMKKGEVVKLIQRKDGGVVKKKLEEEDRQIFHINRSCVPLVAEDKLSVLGFEGIMLGLLVVFSPVLYFRKKRGSVLSGMIRLPSNARF